MTVRDDNPDDVVVTIGVCAMEKKAMSKPMKEILRRMEKFQHITIIVFDEDVILNQPIESWPICDALVSFYSDGFPLEKAIAYSKLRNPYLVNDLESQYRLMDRRLVYECLEQQGVPVPRYACVCRKSGSPSVTVIENDDCIEINGEVFHKPFVEKPLNAEDHNVYIYFPSSAGGGSQRLFRKVGNLSSKYSACSSIRTSGSYMYEEFMPTDGTDVKVYTVADYAHAEARKSPALDGKVERDHEGKEVRYPVILTQREKKLAMNVSEAFRQKICGFDLLRANGMSYVCDVNGFSFVKSSRKYYDDCSHILGILITREIAPQLCLSSHLPPGTDVDIPLVSTTCGTIMELRCVIAVIRHGDRTPKQKLKMEVRHEKFFQLFKKYAPGGLTHELKLKRPAQLQEVLDIVRSILDEINNGLCTDPEIQKNEPKFNQLRTVLEMYGTFSGINRKIQLKYHLRAIPKGSQADRSDHSSGTASSIETEQQPSLLLVVKWGGELTSAGRQQAEKLGKSFRHLYPGGDGNYGKDPGLGLLRLHSTYRHDLKIYASDEGRVQMTAAAFAKGFLALEGELPPILVQMVKSANTNGLLDNDNDCRQYQNVIKHRIRNVMLKDHEFTQEDFDYMVPTKARSLLDAMKAVGNPLSACGRLSDHVKELYEHLRQTAFKERNEIKLYQGESWELLLRRWGKLHRDFGGTDGEFDVTKISDIYDNIKYDLLHNPKILKSKEEFFKCAKSLAEIVVPQEYGITIPEKLRIGQRICTPLMRKVLSDARYTDVDECTRLHAGYSKGVASPDRFVRTRLYFTSESHIHSLLTCLRYGNLADVSTDEQWRRSMDFIDTVSEINYLSQIVIMIYEDPKAEPKTEQRFHVELYFSPGAYASHEHPEGTGSGPGKLERLNSQASVFSSSTSAEKCSTDSLLAHSSSQINTKKRESSATRASSSSATSTTDKSAAVSPRKDRRTPLSLTDMSDLHEILIDENDHAVASLDTPTHDITQGQILQDTLNRDDLQRFGLQTNLVNSSSSPVSNRDGLSSVLLGNTTGMQHSLESKSVVETSCPTNSEPLPVGKDERSYQAEETITNQGNIEAHPLLDCTASNFNNTDVGKSFGVGRFLITKSITELDGTVVRSATPHAKSIVTLSTEIGSVNVGIERSTFSNATSPCHNRLTRSKLPPLGGHKSNDRVSVSCSPNRCHRSQPYVDVPSAVNGIAISNGLCNDLYSSKYRHFPDTDGCTPISRWIEEQQLFNQTSTIPEVADVTARFDFIRTDSSDPDKSLLQQPLSTLNESLLSGSDLQFSQTASKPFQENENEVVDDSSAPLSVSFIARRHSTESSFVPGQARTQPEVPNHGFSVKMTSLRRRTLSLEVFATSSSNDKSVGLFETGTKESPRRHTCSLENCTFPPFNRRSISNDGEENQSINMAANAMTYPSSQYPYHSDIARLVQAIAQGPPSARPVGGSLISTAVIRGSSSSVPDIIRLMQESNDKTPPKTQSPINGGEFLVPSAPCVPEVYPLETLHNAITLNQLGQFFERLTTEVVASSFTSPERPSSPIYYFSYEQQDSNNFNDSESTEFLYPHTPLVNFDTHMTAAIKETTSLSDRQSQPMLCFLNSENRQGVEYCSDSRVNGHWLSDGLLNSIPVEPCGLLRQCSAEDTARYRHPHKSSR